MSFFGRLFGSNAAPELDGKTPVFEEVGADPSVAPGVDLPPGSVVKFNSAFYWKYGTAATNWLLAPFASGGGGGSPLTTKGDLFGFSTLAARIPIGADQKVLAADSTAALGVSYQNRALVADWTITNVRYFFLDYDAGVDTQLGYIDAAAGSTFTSLQTGAVAIKTMERLYQIVPQVGNGRDIVILQKLRAAGANYLDQDAVTQSNLDTSRWSGYRLFLWRGSTDLSNDATDRVTCGFFNAVAGPNGDSSFTCAAGASTILVPIAAGAIAAEGATQFRLRFLATTTTVALRGICRNITSCVVNASVTCGNALPAPPVAGDVFVIERPGVRVNKFNFCAQNNGYGNAFPGPIAPQVVGIAATTTGALTMVFSGTRSAVCGLEQTAVNTNGVVFANHNALFYTDSFYTDETGASRVPGFGFRWSGGSSFSAKGQIQLNCIGAMNLSATNSVSGAVSGGVGSKSYLGGNWVFTGAAAVGIRQSPGTFSANFIVGDPGATNAQPRVVGSGGVTPFTLQSPISCWRLNFEGYASSTHGAIYVKDSVGGSMNIDGCTSDGTPLYGVDVSGCWDLTVLFGNTLPNTITGTTGEIRTAPMNSTAYCKHADLALVGFVDPQGNKLMGTAGLTHGEAKVFTNNDGTALAPGNLVYLSADTTVKKSLASAASAVAPALVDGVAVSTCANGALALVCPPQGPGYLVCDAAPAVNAMMYLSQTNAGQATSTSPPAAGNNRKLRLGRNVNGNGALTSVRAVLNAELLSVVADGAL